MHFSKNHLLNSALGPPSIIMVLSIILYLQARSSNIVVFMPVFFTCSLLNSMAFPKLNMAAAAALLFVFALARIELSSCSQFVRAKVSCLDCNQPYNFSGIKVLVKCDKVKKLAMATTEDDGSFEVKLPSDSTDISKSSDLPLNCHAKLLGGPTQLYSSRKSMVSRIIETHEKPNSYTISTPLSFYTACPTTYAKCKDMNKLGSSKTINLPLPPEWGLAPSSFYIPCFPIVTGIP